MAITGECFCGEITYEIDGQLTDARSCHCSRCRKAFSAQASAYAVVDGTLTWKTGESNLRAYVNKDDVGYQFCNTCGSMLCGVYKGNVHGVALGCVNGDPNVTLQRHIYVGSKAPWETIAPGVPQYDEDVTSP